MQPFLCPELTPAIAATPPQTPCDLQTMRSEGDRMLGMSTGTPTGVNLDVREIPGGDGQPMELRCFTPQPAAQPPAAKGRAGYSAILLTFHGGGYVAGRARFDDVHNVELAEYLGAVVLSADYRLAPEFPVDRAIADCRAALLYALERGRELGLEVFVFGDSAGAGLAYYSVADLLAESAECPVAGMILFEPCLDPRCESESMQTHAAGPVWTAQANREAWDLAAPSPALRAKLTEILDSPAVAGKMPRSLIVVNPIDPLRDEGLRLALHLADCGVPVEAHMYAGTFHGALRVPGSQTWAELRELLGRFLGCRESKPRD
ncbi:alpha/beta hydrolase [Mobiluncus sp.]|uniref:alpha/beta hydrolase n=1 Tax=Mobiluncus sp. TaxID=47293 RepID=UPI002A90E3EC|nr:alpha/beta hydrolase [Mobiluncus sp.]MDY6076516.1 alpha/beta hydrolase [Mobiluncus sp.]